MGEDLTNNENLDTEVIENENSEQDENPVDENDKEATPPKEQEENNDDSEIYGTPESYDYSEIELPEDIVLDEDLLKEFEPLAKKFNLSNKSANELMGLAIKLTEKNIAKVGNIVQEIQEQKKASFIELLDKDTELNVSNEAEYNKYLDVAIEGVKKFATDGFKELLKSEGLTHHPEFIKTFHKIGQYCIEDSAPDARIPAGKEKLDAAEILFGSDEEK